MSLRVPIYRDVAIWMFRIDCFTSFAMTKEKDIMVTVAEIKIQKKVKLADHCRFGVGGEADEYIQVSFFGELSQAIKYANENNLKYFVYGGGSNVFFDDKGFRGLVIQIIDGKYHINEDSTVTVGAGYNLPVLVRNLADDGYGGIEFLANIPGSVGGAVVGNAGCYGKAIANVLTKVDVYFVKEDNLKSVDPKDLDFGYRDSKLKQDSSSNGIVVSATLKIEPRNEQDIKYEIEQELDGRKNKHPHTAMCAGSFFKNPKNMSAWKIITEAEMTEASVGGAVISSKHANFLVNNGGATSEDILKLARNIRDKVKENLNIDFEPEVRYVGEHGLQEI